MKLVKLLEVNCTAKEAHLLLGEPFGKFDTFILRRCITEHWTQ
jgi:hypothetical protein